MSLSLYDVAAPLYLRMLRNLLHMLEKAEAHAAETGADLSTYAGARLAEDMAPLTRQIQMATDSAKGGAARLAGIAPPSFPDVETTFPELKARISKTIAFVETITPEQMEGDDDRTIELPTPSRVLTFTARNFLLNFSAPNFLFHVVTAYGLLRAQGVPLGKLDYLTGGGPPGPG